jgi:hypothetical protein
MRLSVELIAVRTQASSRSHDSIPPTQPGHRLAAARGRGPRETDSVRKRSELPTVPPPAATPRNSGIRPKRKSLPAPSATVDEVVADLTKDPRRED